MIWLVEKQYYYDIYQNYDISTSQVQHLFRTSILPYNNPLMYVYLVYDILNNSILYNGLQISTNIIPVLVSVRYRTVPYGTVRYPYGSTVHFFPVFETINFPTYAWKSSYMCYEIKYVCTYFKYNDIFITLRFFVPYIST